MVVQQRNLRRRRKRADLDAQCMHPADRLYRGDKGFLMCCCCLTEIQLFLSERLNKIFSKCHVGNVKHFGFLSIVIPDKITFGIDPLTPEY